MKLMFVLETGLKVHLTPPPPPPKKILLNKYICNSKYFCEKKIGLCWELYSASCRLKLQIYELFIEPTT